MRAAARQEDLKPGQKSSSEGSLDLSSDSSSGGSSPGTPPHGPVSVRHNGDSPKNFGAGQPEQHECLLAHNAGSDGEFDLEAQSSAGVLVPLPQGGKKSGEGVCKDGFQLLLAEKGSVPEAVRLDNLEARSDSDEGSEAGVRVADLSCVGRLARRYQAFSERNPVTAIVLDSIPPSVVLSNATLFALANIFRPIFFDSQSLEGQKNYLIVGATIFLAGPFLVAGYEIRRRLNAHREGKDCDTTKIYRWGAAAMFATFGGAAVDMVLNRKTLGKALATTAVSGLAGGIRYSSYTHDSFLYPLANTNRQKISANGFFASVSKHPIVLTFAGFFATASAMALLYRAYIDGVRDEDFHDHLFARDRLLFEIVPGVFGAGVRLARERASGISFAWKHVESVIGNTALLHILAATCVFGFGNQENYPEAWLTWGTFVAFGVALSCSALSVALGGCKNYTPKQGVVDASPRV